MLVDTQLQTMSSFYEQIHIEKYVIMPNHIHLLLHISAGEGGLSGETAHRDSLVSRFIGTFKRFTNRKSGPQLWQARSYDHIVRDE